MDKRAKEHEASGKKFTSIQKVGCAKTEQGAKKTETVQLATYRKNHGGKNPKYNKTKKRKI